MRMQRRGDSFGGDGRSSRTQPVDDAAKGRLACVGTNGWVCHPFRSETGGDEDLGVAEVGLQRGVSFRGLHDVAGCLGLKAGGEVAGRRLETEFGEQLPVFRSVQASWWIRLNCAEGWRSDLAKGGPEYRYREVEAGRRQHPGQRVEPDLDASRHSGC